MKRLSVLAISILLAIVCFAQDSTSDEYRHWTTSEGRRSDVKLKIVKTSKSSVTLERQDNGKVLTLALSKLSGADRRYLREEAERATTSLQGSDSDQPHFRSNYGTSDQTGLPSRWSATENIAWKTALPGPGASTPIIVGDRIYLTCYSGYGLKEEAPGEKDNLQRHLVCLARDDGKIIWDRKVKATRKTHDYGGFFALHGFASSTPVSDGKNVYCLFGNSGVYAFDAADGRQLWNADAGSNRGGFGTSGSLVEHKDVVIANASSESGSLIALNKKNGQEVWRVNQIEESYGAPILVEAGRRTEVVIDTKSKLVAVDADTGEELWTCLGSQPPRYLCPTPIEVDGVIYAMHGYHGPLTAVRPGGRGDVTDTPQRLWALKGFTSTVTSPVYNKGLVFGVKDEGGVVMCCDKKTGTMLDRKRLSGNTGRIYASPLAADGRLYIVTRENGTFVVSADREMSDIAHNEIEDDDGIFNASPLAHQGQLLLRSDRYIYCIGK